MPDVTLSGGPRAGDVVTITGPWPRYWITVPSDVTEPTGDQSVYEVDDPHGAGPYTASFVSAEGSLGGDADGVVYAETIVGPEGPPGPQGEDGPPGPTGPSGPGITPRGAWDQYVVYAERDVVSYEGTSYISRIIGNAGWIPPDNPDRWAIVAEKGSVGPAGPAGPQGPQGSAGPINSIQDEGVSLPTRSKINLIGAGVSAADDAGNDRTNVTVSGGGGGGSAPLIDDPFTQDNFASYTFHDGAKEGLVIANGVLSMSDATNHEWHHTTLRVVDYKMCLKVIPGASPNRSIDIKAWIDANNYVQLVDYVGPATIQFTKVANGSALSVGLDRPSVPGGEPYWLVLRQSGNFVVAETYRVDPKLGVRAPFSSSLMEISGTAEKAAIGAGVEKRPAARLGGWTGSGFGTTDWAIDDWIVVGTPDRGGF